MSTSCLVGTTVCLYCSFLSSNTRYLPFCQVKPAAWGWRSITRTELQDSALWVIIHPGLGRPVPRAAADLGRPVLISSADHLDVQEGSGVWPRGFADLVCGFFELNGRG